MTPGAEFSETQARRTLLVSLISVGMGFSVLFPLLAPLGREMGLSEIQITSIIGLSALTNFLIAPFWGRRSDMWGRKRVILTGLFGFTAGTVVFNLVLYAGLNGLLLGIPLYLTLITARLGHSALMSATMPAANAYMADISPPETRTRAMGAAGAANNIGSILGPAASALAVISLLTPLWVMAAVALINGLFVLRYLPEPPRQRSAVKPPRMRYTDPRILPFVVVGVLMFTGFALVQQTMGFRFQDALGLSATETAGQFGLAMMLSAACSLAAQILIVQRLNPRPFTLLKSALPLLVIAFTVMAIAESQLMLTLAMMVQGFGMGLAGPGFTAGASLAVSPAEPGAVAGVISSCGPLGFALGPLIGGALYQIGPTLPYAIAAGVYLLLLLVTPLLGKRISSSSNNSG